MNEDTKEKARDRNRLRYFRSNRNCFLKRNYGITLKQYDEMLEKQNYSCAICGNKDAGNVRSKYNVFSVDHDHKTGRIRGLLCMSCNISVVPAVEYYSSRIPSARLYLCLTELSADDIK